MQFPGLKRFLLTDAEANTFHSEFTLVDQNLDLGRISLDNRPPRELPIGPGVYCLLMRLGELSYKIYVGRTKSLVRRLGDYEREFQEHSPNDYKLRFFQAFIFSQCPDAKFDLYFCGSENETHKEGESIARYHPLINERAFANDSDREGIRVAFQKYYEKIFSDKLTVAQESIKRFSIEKSEVTYPTRRKPRGGTMTNHEMILEAMKPHKGKALNLDDIKRAILKAFPSFSTGSILPSDHCEGNKGGCWCAKTEKRIFDKASRGMYFVR